MSTTNISICVVSLADYNNNINHSAWIDVTQDPEVIREEIQELLDSSPAVLKGLVVSAEEWEIHDYDFQGLVLDYLQDLEDLNLLAKAIEEHGEPFIVFANENYNLDWAEASLIVSEFENNFLGVCDSTEEWVDLHLDSFENIPALFRTYFDYEKYIRDHEIEGMDFLDLRDGTIAIFRN